jgi:uncharacterized membrane-anchored protein
MAVNWGKITKYAAALFVVQVAAGFLEGYFSPAETSDIRAAVASLIGGSLISFVACAAVFAHLSANQPFRPLAYAWLALLLQVAAGTLLSLAFARWLGNTPPILVLLEWLVQVCALVAGTSIGSNLLRRRGEPADA